MATIPLFWIMFADLDLSEKKGGEDADVKVKDFEKMRMTNGPKLSFQS